MLGEEEKMSKNNRKKVYRNDANPGKNSTFGKVMISIIIIGIVILLFINFVLPVVKKEVADVAAKKTVEILTDNVDKLSGGNPEVAKMIESLSEEDKETVTRIIENHMDAGTVTEVMEYVKDGNKDALIDYAQENLSPSEISELLQIYGKYAE